MSDNNNQEEAKEMVFEIAPIEQITRGEIDIQISTARANPRSLAQFMKRAEAMVCIDQETAESCFYRLERYDKKTKENKVIEGESIRMAEIVAANYGNLRSAVHVIGHTPSRVTVRAVCHDLETNNLIAVEKQAKTTYSNGDPYSEDLAILTANALVSKALRDAIFRVVPRALLKPIKEKARLVAFGTGQSFLDRRKRALRWATETRKVPAARVFAALGIKGEEDMTVEHLERLTGLKNAIMDGDQSVDQAFPELEDESKPNFDHPEKQKQQEETGKGDTSNAELMPEKPKEETKPTEDAKPKATRLKKTVTEEPAKEPEGEKVVQFPTGTDAGGETPKPEPKPEPVIVPLTENQAKLKELIEAGGFQLTHFVECFGKGFFSGKPMPTTWGMIDDKTSGYFVKQIVPLLSGLKTWKAKQKK